MAEANSSEESIEEDAVFLLPACGQGNEPCLVVDGTKVPQLS